MARYLQYNQPQYVSQYVPEDLNFYQQQSDKMQGRYDATQAMYSEALGKLGEMEAYDTETKQKLIDEFTGKFNKTYDKYKEDLSQATSDIMGLVGETRGDPRLAMLKEQRKRGLEYEQMKLKNPNLFFSNDPRAMSVQGVTDPSEFGFETINPEQVVKDFLTEHQGKASKVRESDIKVDPKTGLKYTQTDKGMYDSEIEEMLNDPETYNALIKKYPQYQKFIDPMTGEIDPAFGEFVMANVKQAAPQLNQGYTRNYLPANMQGDYGSGGGAFTGIVPLTITASSGAKNIATETGIEDFKDFKKVNEKSSPLAKKLKTEINESLVTEEALAKYDLLESPGLINFTVKDEDGKLNPEATIEKMENFLDKNSIQSVQKEKNYQGSQVWVDPVQKQNRLALYDKEISRIKTAGRFLDFYKKGVESLLVSENSDIGIKFEDFNLATGNTKLDNFIQDRIPLVKQQFERMNADDLEFYAVPKGAEDLMSSKEKDRYAYKSDKDNNLLARGELMPVGIGFTAQTGIIFRVEDSKGNEYTVRPKNIETISTLANHWDNPSNPRGYIQAEQDYQNVNFINDNIENLKDLTFREYLETLDTYNKKSLIYTMKAREIPLDSKIKYLKH